MHFSIRFNWLVMEQGGMSCASGETDTARMHRAYPEAVDRLLGQSLWWVLGSSAGCHPALHPMHYYARTGPRRGGPRWECCAQPGPHAPPRASSGGVDGPGRRIWICGGICEGACDVG